MNMLRHLLPLLALACSPLFAADIVVPRNGCPNAFRKFAESQTSKAYTKITFFGGSITEGAGASKPELCYRSLTMKQLHEDYAGATLAENNSAIGGTGSWLGAFRTKSEALYGGAALVFVEFAVNDGSAPEAQVLASMEGIVRQIWSRDSSIDIVFLYTLAKNHMDAYRAGQLPDRVQWHERIAERYGIPSVNMAQYAAQKILAGELTFEEFAKDGVHPTDRGYALYMEALKPFLAACKSAGQLKTPAVYRDLKKFTCVSPAPMEKAQCVPYDWAKADAGWKFGQPSPTERFFHLAVCDQPGALLTLAFTGSQVGVFDVIGPDTGDLDYSVDQGAWQTLRDFDSYCVNSARPHARPLATGLDPQQRHELRLRVNEKIPENSKGHVARLGFLLVDGDVADPCANTDTLARCDAIYASMDKLAYTPPPAPGRWKNLDRTMQRLREGGTLKIVMLGDSIIGDTSSSHYELMLHRLYPKCAVVKQTSVRGSTGCWWYKNDNQVEPYVLTHTPDLLMIGGISQREDIDAIREVIHQVRAKQNPEILLMTPAFGATPDKHIKEWTFEPAPGSYRDRLRQLAEEEKCGFIDMTGPWWRYVLDSGKCYGWFQRDRVHANDRGFQILGRIIETFFAP